MICDNEVAAGSKICMMPDIHPGKIAPIGLSMTVTDKVIPQLLGVDIGCGRRLKREDVKSKYTVSDFKREMKGIYSSCIGADTLDEAPFAYRSIKEIAEQIRDTVKITDILKPFYNYKAGSRK